MAAETARPSRSRRPAGLSYASFAYTTIPCKVKRYVGTAREHAATGTRDHAGAALTGAV